MFEFIKINSKSVRDRTHLRINLRCLARISADYASGFLRPVARWGQRGLLIVIIPSKYVQPTLGQGSLLHTLPGSIVLARMATCATSMKLSVPPFLPKTRLFRQDLSSPPRPSRSATLPPSSRFRVSSALNFSKIIAASSPLNRRDNRGVAKPRRLMTSLARETQNEITFFRKSCLILGNYPVREPLPFSPSRVGSLVIRSVICYLSRTKLSIAHVSRDM